MKELHVNRFYSASLNHKILFGFLFSLLPMLIIVMVTYFSARESALESSHNQIRLISDNGGEKVDAFFRSRSNTFLEWTQEDVFGMGIEFDALDELKKHLSSLQRQDPEFTLLQIADESGVVLEESRISYGQDEKGQSPKGRSVKDFRLIKNSADRAVFLVENPSGSTLESQSRYSLLFSFRTAESSGAVNGYFLAYMGLQELTGNTDAILDAMKQSGFATSRVFVMDTGTGQVVGYSGKPSSGNGKTLAFPLDRLLRESAAGEITSFVTEYGTEHVVFVPLVAGESVGDTALSLHSEVNLCLLLSVEEREIMAKVRQTLLAAVIIGGVGVLAIIIIGFFTIRAITGPIGNLVAVLQQYAGGDAGVRAEVKSRDEIGYFADEFNSMLEQINSSGRALQDSEARYRMFFENLQGAVNSQDYAYRFTPGTGDDDLAVSLNRMLDSLETGERRAHEEDWLKTGLTRLSEKISGEHKLEDLCANAITFIAGYTGVQVATLFVRNRNDEEDWYELIASYAFRKRKGLTNRYKAGEGLVGQAALEKQVIHFTDIPDDYIRIESSLGMMTPKNVLIIPLVYEGDVKGVIELGASFSFTTQYIHFCEQVSSVIAVAINAAIANDRLKELLEQTRKQSETLRVQQAGLQSANQELEEQTEILKESEARLQVQQEELQASNEEMEEKNEMLESQKRENEVTNRNLREKKVEIEEKARQLELATKYKSEFLSNMSHELRTPLNSILLLAKMLSENEEKNLTEGQVESAASIHRGGQTLLHLINDILDLSKIEAGRVDLNLSSSRPETIVANFEVEFNHLAKSKGLEFTTELGGGLPDALVTDVHRLEQIIRNMLGNAFKFTETGSVKLRIARPTASVILSRKDIDLQSAVAFSVIDTGIGIPQEKLQQVFEAFKQADGSISRRHGGTGLGLSISRELAGLLGGEIIATSEVNQGAEFTLVIPEVLTAEKDGEEYLQQKVMGNESGKKNVSSVQQDTPADTVYPDSSSAEEGDLALTGKRMLIIEDDQEFSNILSTFFEKNGYESIVASTGEIGVKYAIEHKPTAVILDIGLPGIDGWTVLSELKNNPDTRHIPVHIMSAYDETGEGLKKGAVGYLTKPVSSDGLKSAMGKIEHVLNSEVKELLVVEDDKELRESIMKLMGTQDIQATAAATGSQVMELLRTKLFDCMILDLGLPDISGFTLLDEIEKDVSISRPPVIIYTGRDLTREEAAKLEKYSSTIVLKSAYSLERLLDETALFLHQVEKEMPESQRKMIQDLRDKDSSLTGKKVLLVDDDMRNAFALSKFLKSRGMIVTIADNGEKALEILDGEAVPDIVLMDIMMPVMDGYETMKAIRKRKGLKDLPILALTAKAMETDREECIRCGANDYLSKPIDTTKLLSMLRIWMY